MSEVETVSLLEKLRSVVELKDRRYRLSTYKNCFVGSDAVSQMVKIGLAENREEAVKVGQALLEVGEVNHVTRDHEFKDEALFYRFTEDENHGAQAETGKEGTWAKFLGANSNKDGLQAELPEYQPYGSTLDHPVEAEEVGITPLTEHNVRLLDNVRPTGWVNPEPKTNYNLVAIGAGAGGLVSSSICASLGGTVALIEKHLLGGDCLNVGCVPSKALISAAHAVHTVKNASHFGVNIKGEIEVDFSAIMERMRRLRADISPNDSASRFTKEIGVDVFQGTAKFISKNEVEVDGKVLKFSKCILAMGGRPKLPPIPGIDTVNVLTNVSIFNLTKLPPRLGVIGAGPIGMEMAQAFARFGSNVTVFMRGDHILSKEDEDAALIVEKSLQEDGVQFKKNVVYDRIEKDQDKIKVFYKIKGEETQEFHLVVDELLVSAGRAPNVNGMNLEKAGVAFNERDGVQVNDQLQTTNSNIYAVGDCCTRFQFTHVADFMARMAIRNAFFFGSGKFSQMLIPWATFTSPEIAHVGLYESDAKRKGIKYSLYTKQFDDVDRAILDGEDSTKGFVKIMCKGSTDEIIGATIVGDHAGDMISEISVAIQNKVKLGQIANVIHPYPTQGEAIRQAGDLFNKTKLTPTVKKLLRGIIKLR
mmetsp:Transcript_4592/g.6135  ORF Transcript_4592/g.6135 Transcript_4592/m.6135 type:complete len:646 (-) Transcript_4592:91-2028(-)|eukprot:CAMPEP_0184013904 /NCGR_PEP_ID=MMETSP0954-20121128/5304_1 /TAXON_ID=627963 /ORGANISM="Aplanochytrium sp, Strain PBS07" /LENGTH=645 /DNA_ID=CAMNT_0026294209 /DNA_START=95 /DNA_END=2032 /DNA_ORIENTATION=+